MHLAALSIARQPTNKDIRAKNAQFAASARENAGKPRIRHPKSATVEDGDESAESRQAARARGRNIVKPARADRAKKQLGGGLSGNKLALALIVFVVVGGGEYAHTGKAPEGEAIAGERGTGTVKKGDDADPRWILLSVCTQSSSSSCGRSSNHKSRRTQQEGPPRGRTSAHSSWCFRIPPIAPAHTNVIHTTAAHTSRMVAIILLPCPTEPLPRSP